MWLLLMDNHGFYTTYAQASGCPAKTFCTAALEYYADTDQASQMRTHYNS